MGLMLELMVLGPVGVGKIASSTLEFGTPFGLQFVEVFQSPVTSCHVKVVAKTKIGKLKINKKIRNFFL